MYHFPEKMGPIRVLIATVAFGMGIKVNELYTVIQYSPSDDLDDYVHQNGSKDKCFIHQMHRESRGNSAEVCIKNREKVYKKNIKTRYCKKSVLNLSSYVSEKI